MEAFTELRRQARERRDKSIKLARDEYAATLTRIATLEQDLLGRDKPDHRTISSCIDSVIPKDRTFTTVDLMTSLEALDPRRNWRKRSLDTHISRLREKGIIRRVSKSKNNSPAIYVRTGTKTDPIPFEGMTLAEVVRKVLAERQPLRGVELSIAILEAGYQTAMTRDHFRTAVSVILRKGGFANSDGKWSVA